MKRLSLAVTMLVACANPLESSPTSIAAAPTTSSIMPVKKDSPLPPDPVEEVPSIPTVRRAVRELPIEAEWLSKICVSEGGFDLEECEKLLQTLENMRERREDRSLLRAMFVQSSRVTRRKPFTDPRQVWVSYLPMRGDGRPLKGWVNCPSKSQPTGTSEEPLQAVTLSGQMGCTGNWGSVGPKWAEFRQRVVELYWSGIVPEPIQGKPIQWGGAIDYWRGASRGFCPLNVGGKRSNTYWGDPRDPANDGVCLPIDPHKVRVSQWMTRHYAKSRHTRHDTARGLAASN